MVDVNNFSASKTSIKSFVEFETELKTRLKWNKNTWLEAGEQGSRLNKLVNSMHYWKTRLKPAMDDESIVFTIFNQDRDIRTEVGLLLAEIEALDDSVRIKGYSSFRNPRYLCVHFENKQDKEKIVEKFKMAENGFVVHLEWAFNVSENVDIIKVHWLPMTFSMDLIKKELSKYVNFIEQERFELKLMSGRTVPSGSITFKMSLKDGQAADSVPHTVVIGKMEALLTIPGRLPMCLNCSALGHISKNCNQRYCQKCKQMKNREHECQDLSSDMSYASKVKGNASGVNYVEQEDWGAGIEEEQIDDQVSIPASKLLENKITDLKNKVQLSKLEAEDKLKTRSEKKRKVELTYSKTHKVNEETQDRSSESGGDKIEVDSSSSDISDEDDSFQGNVDQLRLVEFCQETNAQGILQARGSNISTKSKGNKNKAANTKENLLYDIYEVSDSSNETVRSYGKPKYKNARRQKEQKAYEKACQKSPDNTDFVFKD